MFKHVGLGAGSTYVASALSAHRAWADSDLTALDLGPLSSAGGARPCADGTERDS
jgi:hypothetical protein